jgi:hypothetical protein
VEANSDEDICTPILRIVTSDRLEFILQFEHKLDEKQCD